MVMEHQIPTESGQIGESEQRFHDLRHGFRVGFLQLMLQSQLRAEVVPMGQVCPIPDTPDWFIGFINHRGDVVPVYDLAASLGLEATERKSGWLLLLDEAPHTAAVLLAEPPQGVADPELMPAAGQQPYPALLQGISQQQYQHQNSLWFELDHHAYFAAQKQRFHNSDTGQPSGQ